MIELRVMIVDDEPLARQRLRRLLGGEQDLIIVGECPDGRAALQAISTQKPNLLLLDIQMPGVDGFGVVEQLGANALPVVVFVTAYDQHAIHAFEACALDYLLKPVSKARLAKTINRVRKHLELLGADVFPQNNGEQEGATRFLVRNGQRTSFVSPEEIEWIEADGNYAVLHVAGRNHLLRATMSALESMLPDPFLLIARA